jgi:DSF synthase
MNIKLLESARFDFDRVEAVGSSLAIAATAETARPQDQLPCYDELDVEFDARSGTYWGFMKPRGRPSFTRGLLHDLDDMQDSIKRMAAARRRAGQSPVRYFVLASRVPGVFNLGGDLTLFADLIRKGDRPGLQSYARACIDVLHTNSVALDLPLVTIALVQGHAQGGGFEAALACDVIVAEKNSKFGLPEILFGLFPGMGAYSLLSRRLDAARAEKIILSGRIFTAEELHEMGIVTVLAEPGSGEGVVREYVQRRGRRQMAEHSVYKTRRRIMPITYEELRDVTEIWVDTALGLDESDLRKMQRLISAQNRMRPQEVSIAQSA